MSKKIEKQSLSKSDNNVQIERTVSSDDSFLPEATELERLKTVDPTIIPWLLETTKIEQKHRHNFDDNKVGLLKKALNTERLTLLLMFSLSLIFIIFCFILVWNEKNAEGSIFGLFGVLGAVFFYRHIYKNKTE